MGKFKDLTGQKFGDLLVIKRIDNYVMPSGKQDIQWECICNCGNVCNKTTTFLLHSKCVNLHCGCKPINYVDKTGNRYGRLVVIGLSKTKNKNGKPIFSCKCDCGNIVDISSNSLRENGGTKSCGCLNTESRIKLGKDKVNDLSNQKFGRLTVMYRVDNAVSNNGKHSFVQWHCKCDCGNEVDVIAGKLTSGNTKSCGCLFIESVNSLKNDLTNKRFGRLLVLERSKNTKEHSSKSTTIYYNCLCDCGNVITTSFTSLVSGHSLSCGCLHKELTSERSVKDISGQRFGKLVVIERVGTSNDRKAKWRCLCDCGNIYVTTGKNLREGSVISCGCIKSSGEFAIREYLNKEKIDFVQQYKFKDCKDKSLLPFDFYIPQYDLCIEYQGQQHYYPVDFAGKGVEWANKQFEIVKSHDCIKRTYCETNNINFLEISYLQYNNISEIINNFIKNISQLDCEAVG